MDAFHYWTVGLQLAEKFQIAGWTAFQPPYWSTNLINNICGIATLLIGDALPTLFIALCSGITRRRVPVLPRVHYRVPRW